MSLGKLAGLACFIACVVSAQDLAPEVVLLSQIKSRLKSELVHLPDYTCLETFERFHKEPPQRAKFRPRDTVRLEVGYSGHREWYAWPGDLKFTAEDPSQLAGAQGLIATGVFAHTLHNLFLSNAAVLTPRGEDTIGGRQAVKFDFRFPARSQICNVSILGGSGWVNEEGSIWVDRQSLELLRLDGRATEIPPYLPLAGMEYTMNFARTRIGDSDALLAQDATLHMQHNEGFEDYDAIAFTHCRMFHASSTLSFDADPGAPEAPAPAPAAPVVAGPEPKPIPPQAGPERSVPALLRVTVELTSQITSDDETGMPIEGRIAGDVRRKGKVVLENGTPVRGRIRYLVPYEDGSHFILGVEFTEVEANGVPLRFYADLIRLENWKGVRPALRKEVQLPNRYGSTMDITLPELPGVASFFVDGKTFVLRPGLRTEWQTRGLLRGVD